PSCTSWKCRSATPPRRRWKTASRISAGVTRFAPTCSMTRASRTCVPASNAAIARRCSTATSTATSRPASSRVCKPSNPSVGACQWRLLKFCTTRQADKATMSDQQLDQNELQQEENKLIAQRKEKLAAVREQGIAFPNDFRRDSLCADLQKQYEGKSKEE